LQEFLKDYPKLTIKSGSVADLVLNDQMTEEEHQCMVKKGASQMVKGVRIGKSTDL
jgi:tRNA uridine 5-carboxymethylaminomethyl modification enzyme